MIHRNDRHEAAAEWLQRLEHPDVKEEELHAWLEWFGTSDSNRKAFEELQTLRRTFREMPDAFRRELKHRTHSPVGGDAFRARMKFAIAASVIAALAGLGAWWTLQTNVERATYTASAERHETVALKDGSSLVLGANAVVGVAYSQDLRSLDVQRGEAYFEVRQDPHRPFVVQAGKIRITAIGTAFNVQRDADTVTVTVTEGRVAVNEAGAQSSVPPTRTYLTMGQQAVLPLAMASVAAAPRPASTADWPLSKWNRGRADFINAPLSEVLPVINRYAPTTLVIDDPRVADLTYSGTILRAHLDEWIASLPTVYAIRVVPLEDGTVTLVSRSGGEK